MKLSCISVIFLAEGLAAATFRKYKYSATPTVLGKDWSTLRRGLYSSSTRPFAALRMTGTYKVIPTEPHLTTSYPQDYTLKKEGTLRLIVRRFCKLL